MPPKRAHGRQPTASSRLIEQPQRVHQSVAGRRLSARRMERGSAAQMRVIDEYSLYLRRSVRRL